MRYFICPEDTDCIPCIEAGDLEEAKEKWFRAKTKALSLLRDTDLPDQRKDPE